MLEKLDHLTVLKMKEMMRQLKIVKKTIRCRLSFSLLRSAVLCLRGARSSRHRPVFSSAASLELAIVEGRLSVD